MRKGLGVLGFLSLGDSAFCFDGATDSLPSRKRSRKRKPRTSLHPSEVLKSSTERSLQGLRPRSRVALDPPKPAGRHPRGRGIQHAGRAAASPPAGNTARAAAAPKREASAPPTGSPQAGSRAADSIRRGQVGVGTGSASANAVSAAPGIRPRPGVWPGSAWGWEWAPDRIRAGSGPALAGVSSWPGEVLRLGSGTSQEPGAGPGGTALRSRSGSGSRARVRVWSPGSEVRGLESGVRGSGSVGFRPSVFLRRGPK